MRWLGALQVRWTTPQMAQLRSGNAAGLDDRLLDQALRATIRGEVAGAVPRSDAWERLQGRITAEPGQSVAAPRREPVPTARRWASPGPWGWVMVGRFPQLGVVALLLLVLAGQPRVMDHFALHGRVLATPTAEARNEVRLAVPVPRVNRAEQAINVGEPVAPERTPVQAEEAPVLAPERPTPAQNGGPDGLGWPPRPVHRALVPVWDKEPATQTGRAQ